jgi:putative component of membrane protein insertase Oxa1/YidC/SpoIIIJ protein YidD
MPLLCFAEVGYVEPWGKDSGLRYIPQESAPEQKPLSPLGYLATQVIRFHQNVISQIDGPRSHYRPSSSQYMQEAIHKYGFFKGFIMGCDRLLRENDDPWLYRTTLYEGRLYKADAP